MHHAERDDYGVPRWRVLSAAMSFMGNLLLLTSCWLLAADAPVSVRAATDVTQVELVAQLSDQQRAQIVEGKLSPEQGERVLRLCLVDTASQRVGPAMFGSYERRGPQLIFTPRHPLQHGQLYRATFDADGKSISTDYLVAQKPSSAAARVDKIYPSADILPANQLKFYIHFSKPMREGKDIFDRIRILDADGQPIAEPWRRTELWSADFKRLTIWIHPGRIKQSVNLRDEEGPVLHPGQRYTLEIGAALLDADGQPLGRAFTKRFRTAPEKHTRPLVQDWKVETPAADRSDPVIVRFPEPLDHALLARMLRVVDAAGKEVRGKIVVGAEERSWSFTPDRPWRRQAEYVIHVNGEIEDLAGNTPLKPFDVDLTKPAPKAGRLTMPFRPEP